MAGGRPTSLTPEVQAAICSALRGGNYRHTAAASAGVHRNRLSDWEKRGELAEQHLAVCVVDDCATCRREEPYAAFMVAMISAEASAEVELVDEIRNAKSGNGEAAWTSRAWILERRYAQRWAGRVKQQAAEAVDALTEKLKADPELHKRVMDVLTSDQESAAAGPGTGH